LKEEVLPYLNEIGIRPGALIRVKDVAPLEGPMTVETDDGITSLGRELAALVRVAENADVAELGGFVPPRSQRTGGIA
jgi:Fe2+ transport system protein FeoA